MYPKKTMDKRLGTPSPKSAGPGARRLERRMKRKLTSLEVRMVALGQQEPGSPNKRAQKRAKRAMKLRRAARFIVGCLIRATGAAAPELVLQPTRLDFHRTRLTERGADAVYFPKLAVV